MKQRTARQRAIWTYYRWLSTRRCEVLVPPCVHRQYNREARAGIVRMRRRRLREGARR